MTHLIPEQRLDKNGKTVTRWVKKDLSGGHRNIFPSPAAKPSPTKLDRFKASQEVMDFAFTSADDALYDIYDLEMDDPIETWDKCRSGLALLSDEALSSIHNVIKKDSEYNYWLPRELVANTVYRLGDCTDDERATYSLQALHAEFVSDLVTSKFKEFGEYDPLDSIYGTIHHSVNFPIENTSREDQSRRALLLSFIFPDEDFDRDSQTIRSMADKEDMILGNIDIISDNIDVIRARKMIDFELLEDIKKNYSALRTGVL